MTSVGRRHAQQLVTYAANAWDFWDLFKDSWLYWPRFVRVNLGAK
jgi:hypothetical protein